MPSQTGNVLGFDPYRVNTCSDDELRELVAFRQIDLKLKERDPEAEVKKRTTEEYLELIESDDELRVSTTALCPSCKCQQLIPIMGKRCMA